MHRFFADGLGQPGARVLLARDETHHLVGVLRAKPGEEIALFDGSGREAVARLLSLANRRAEVEVLSVRSAPPDAGVEVTVATAIPKGPRMADLVRSCTEVGVARIQPMICERSVVRSKRSKGGRTAPAARLVRVARDAARQSRRAHVPEIMPAATFDEVVSKAGGFDLSLIADVSAKARPVGEAFGAGRPGSVLVMIGPEGGFTERERATAAEAGCRPVRLECPVMRVETAAAVLAAIAIYACS